MIRRLLKIAVLVLLVAVVAGLAYLIHQHPGYVLITYQGFRYESTLWMFIGLLLLILVVLQVLRWALRFLLFSGRTLNPWSRYHSLRRTNKAAEQGRLALAESRWQAALVSLSKAAERSEQPLSLYLGAARAANELAEGPERDALLNRALQRLPGASLAIVLARAELQAAAGEPGAALATLQEWEQEHPRQAQVLIQKADLLRRLQYWPELLELLPVLRKERLLGQESLIALQKQAWAGHVQALCADPQALGATAEALEGVWRQLSSELREDTASVLHYGQALHRLEADERAEVLLRKAIAAHYDPALVELYGLLQTKAPAQQLKEAERWLPGHPQDAILLRCLGRLSVGCQLWGKARDYLQSSLNFDRLAETSAELARLLAQLGDTEASQQLFLDSLQLSDPLGIRPVERANRVVDV